MRLEIEKIRLDLTVNWKLSRNQTTFKENFILRFETPIGVFLGEVAPNIRYLETPESVEKEFFDWKKSVDFFSEFSLKNLSEILLPIRAHSLRFGLESVFLSYFSSLQKKTLSEFLGLSSPRKVETSFSMPILPVGEIKDYLEKVKRFKSLKIKVNADSAVETIREVRKYSTQKLRIDGNEAWRDFESYKKFEETLKGAQVELIEQPFPSSMNEEYASLKRVTPYKILADESIEDVGDFSKLSQQFHAINVKLMKTGSLLRAKELIESAREYNLQVMMGCMIETTVGISYGMLFSGMVDYVDLDGFLLIKDEPFQLVKESEGQLSLA
jgi:L-alanine-DL-glutamate epimerase-like enolase superfamily enzyme